MRRICTALLAAFILGSVALRAQDSNTAPELETVAGDIFDYESFAKKAHPRLFIDADGLKTLKKKVTGSGRKKNPVLAQLHDEVMKTADRLLEKPEIISYTFDASNRRILPISKRAFRSVFHLAYAWKMTGDERYLEAARVAIQKFCDFPDWNARHFLDAAEMCMAAAVAYDWLYDVLNPVELDRLRECMVNNAMTQTKYHGFAKPGTMSSLTNWNQVCVCGLVCASIAIWNEEPELCHDLVQKLLPTNKRAQTFIYAPEGVYPEGYMYWDFGTQYETMLLQALKAAFGSTWGLDETPGFMNTGRYILYMTGVNRQSYSYCDCVRGWWGKPGAWYFAAKSGDLSLLCNEAYLLRQGKYPDGGDCGRFLPVSLCMAKDLNINSLDIPMPEKEVFWGNGLTPVVLVHTGWKYDADDKYLGFKGGQSNVSHSQMDEGSFVYDAYGVRWSDDLGREAYTHIETPVKKAGGNFWTYEPSSMRWEIFRYSNWGHSTLTVNRSNFDPAGRSEILEVYESDPNNLGGKVDLTGPLHEELLSATRSIRLVNREDLVVTDELEALPDKPAEVIWRMITPTKVEPSEDFEILSKNGVSMKLKAQCSDGSLPIEYKAWPATRPDWWTPRTWDTPNKGYSVAGYVITVPAGRKVTLTTTLSRAL